jgi:hypothetical protein
MELETFKDKMIEAAKACFDMDGEARPMAIFLTKSGQLMIMPLGTLPDKDTVSSVVKKTCSAYPIVALVLVWEAWYVHRKEINPEENVSEAEDRKEVLTVTFETKLTSKTYTWDIHREKLKPYLTKGIDVPGGEAKGRFVNLLTEPLSAN